MSTRRHTHGQGTATRRYRLGIDVGGTFTDGILIDEESGGTRIAKVPSTPGDPSVGFLEAVERILREAGVEAAEVGSLVHGTTVATNAIIEGKLAPTGFFTTEGFRDMLEIQRQIRPSLYDLLFEKPRPLAPRHRCFGIPERLDAAGAVLAPLDEQAVAAAAGQLKAEGVEALAICYLHAYINPAHERRTREIVHEVFPEAVVSLSSETACADPLGLDVVEVALGIVEIANNAMVGALRRISVQRGHDPRDFVLVAFGGAGPVHANRLAAELDVPTVLVPMGPGATSAMGLLVTDVKHDYSATLIQRADRLDVALVNRRYREMEEQGEEALLSEGMGHAGIAFERQVDMRYVGQSYELSIPFGDGKVEDGLDAMLEVDDGFTHGPAVRAGVLDGDERGGPHREVLRDGAGASPAVRIERRRHGTARALEPGRGVRGVGCRPCGGLAQAPESHDRGSRRIGGFSRDRAGIEGARHGPAVPPDAGRRRGRRRPAAAQPAGETRRLA